MATVEPRAPVQVGEPAPDFTLPAVDRDELVSLSDYRGKSPVLLALNRGLWCAFCRRHIAQLGTTREKLQAAGVETLAVVATPPERARLYVRFHPVRVRLAADPDLQTHQAFGLPKPSFTPDLIQAAQQTQTDAWGELPAPVPVAAAIDALNKRDNFQMTETDRADHQHQYLTGPQMAGQFLVDRAGIVRWAHIECAEGLGGAGKLPTDEEILAADRAL